MPPDFTDAERALIRETARLVIADLLAAHIVSCPHGQKILRACWTMVGIGIGCTLGGGVLGGAIVKAIIFK